MTAKTPARDEVSLRVGMSPQEIYAAYGLTCPPRVGTLRNPAHKTYGAAVAGVARKLGSPFMPWQRYAADVALEVNPATGGLVYRDVTLLVPRQSGKTTLILAVKSHRALYMGREARRHRPAQGSRQRILYAAQTRNAAREKFVDDQLPILLDSPLRSRFTPRLSNGSESLIWDTGAYDGITSNTETAGHGKTLDLGVEDEFFAAEDFRLEQAFSPAMITRWSPQHWRISTEGTEKSLYLAAKVERGREIVERGEPSASCYLEWSNLDGPRSDPRTWWSCMPALGFTVTEEVIAAECDKLSDEEFDRAYLNRRRGLRARPDANVPSVDAWGMLADPLAQCGEVVAMAVDITPARDRAAIGIVGAGADGKRHVELIDARPGTDWLVARILQLNEQWRPVAWVLDGASPARSLIVDLEQRGIKRASGEPKRGDLWPVTAQDLAAACGSFTDAVRAATLVHIGQPEMAAALGAARSRPLGDAYAWARKAAAGDISPLVVATLALAGFEARKHLGVEHVPEPSAFYV